MGEGLILPAEVVEYLTRKFGERFAKALQSYRPEKVSKLTISYDDELEITASVVGSKSIYACYFSPKKVFCSCTDQTIRKILCKHLFIMLLSALDQGLIRREELMKYLIWR